MSERGWIVLAVANIPVYIGVGWLFFRTWDDFWEAVRFWLTPDILSAFRGEYWEDSWAEIKLGLWVVCCVCVVLAEAQLIQQVFG